MNEHKMFYIGNTELCVTQWLSLSGPVFFLHLNNYRSTGVLTH